MPPPTNASAGASGNATITTEQVDEKIVVDESPNMQIVPSGSIMMGPTEQGGRNGKPFSIDSQSNWGDYFTANFNGAVLFDLFGFGGDNKKARFRLGPRVDFNHTRGNENTGGSNYNQITGALQVELDWTRAWGRGLGGVLKGPSYFNIYGGVGYGWGTGTAETFSLHEQSGPATNLGLGLNVLNFNVRGLQIGADAAFQTTGIWGSSHNSPQNTFLFGLTFRPGVNKTVRTEKVDRCDDDVAAIAMQEEELKRLRAHNDKVLKLLTGLRNYLDNHPKNFFTEANMHKAIRLGAVVDQLKDRVDKTKLAAMVQAGSKPDLDINKLPEVVAQTTGISVEEARTVVAKANTDEQYTAVYKFWEAPGDSQFQINPNLPKNPSAENCKDIQKYRDELTKAIGDLRERKGHLDALYKTAVYLAGLFLGEQPRDIFSATMINVDTPNFKTARPNEADMNKLGGGTSVDAIADQVFMAPKFERDKLDKLAAWLKGEGELPGEEITRKIITEELGKKGQTTDIDTPEGKAAYRELIKQLSLGIFGHTDSDGTDENNQKLSERRANFIKAYLVAKGVSADRLVARGFGEKYPKAPEGVGNFNERTVAKAKNRRTEFVPIRIQGPITPGREQVPDHVDARDVPKTEGGTKTERPAAKPAAKPATTPAPATAPKKTGDTTIDFGTDDKKKP